MHSENFDPASIAIATATSYPKWYRGKLRSIKHTDKIRGDLALEFAFKARKKGYYVVASDWQSTKSFRKELSNIPGVFLIKRRSPKRSPSKRKAIYKASKLFGVKAIVLTEAEKVSLIEDCLPQGVEPILNGEVDIVVPKRNHDLFRETYPSYQYNSENEGNKIYNEVLRSNKLSSDELDMFFGPRIFANSKKVIQLFMKQYDFNISNTSLPKEYFDAEQLSNVNFFPIVMALKKQFRIKSITVPFKYPLLQKQNEDIGSSEHFLEKRKFQRISLITELLYFIAYLNGKK